MELLIQTFQTQIKTTRVYGIYIYVWDNLLVYMIQKYYFGSEMEEVNLLLNFLKKKWFFPQLLKAD